MALVLHPIVWTDVIPERRKETDGFSRLLRCACSACVRVCRGGAGSAGIIVTDFVGAEASEARRSDSEHLRLGIEEAEIRLSTGRTGALPPVLSVRLCSSPVVWARQASLPTTGGTRGYAAMEGTLRIHLIGLHCCAPSCPVPPCPAPPCPALPCPALPRPTVNAMSPPALTSCVARISDGEWRG